MLIESNVVIKDACILFDLIDLELLDDFFKLDVKPVTTGFVISEILDQLQLEIIQTAIEQGKLTVFDNGDIDNITILNDEYAGLSFADCSVLELAFRVPGIILSADASLRKVATARNLTVKGILWIINQLFEKGILSKEECLAKLDLYPQINKRPAKKSDIEKLINKLNGL